MEVFLAFRISIFIKTKIMMQFINIIKKQNSKIVLLFLVLGFKNSVAQCTSSYNYTLGSNGTVYFNSTSVGTTSATNYFWNFGNSTSLSGTNIISPSATYTTNGNYVVSLSFVTPLSCTVSSNQTITISNVTGTCNLVANFSYSLGNNGLVNFTNTSVNTNSTTIHNWNFGNGSNSTAINPTLTYSTNGTYPVCLSVSNSSGCVNNFCQNIIISNSTNTCNIVAAYSGFYGNNGLVTFTNSSVNTNSTTTYFWNFGNGVTSSSTNPTITYTANGVYNICLTAFNGGTVCSATSCNNFTVSNVLSSGTCSLVANFSQNSGSNGTVTFSNTSVGTNTSSTYYWDFGDGNTSTGFNVSHTYSVNGTYSVTLLVNNTNMAFCTSTTNISVTITNSAGGCVANSGFNLAPTSTVSGNWTATPVFPWNVTAAIWSWGDGSLSNTLYTSHQYSASGTYSICLTVTVSCGVTSSTCANYFIYKTSNPMIYINVVAPGLVPTNILNNNAIEAFSFDIYPNPNNGQFTLKCNNEYKDVPLKICIYNLIGELIYDVKNDNNELNKDINLNNISDGIYIFKVITTNFEFSKKIVISK